MSHHLIEISFGPVQGFIAAARRSRDLWAGSRFLSEVVRAAAKRLQAEGAVLIYPRPEAVANNEGSNLSNVLLAHVAQSDPARAAALAASAQRAGLARLQELADREKAAWLALAPDLRVDLWDRQVASALECFAAWSAWDGSDHTYRQSYDALKTAFARRKNTRDFTPAPSLAGSDAGLPKSSLDGTNESVLPKQRSQAMARRMGISPGEQLDALGCMKRSYGRREDFTALTRLAADAWLRKLQQENPAKLDELVKVYEPLVSLGLATRCAGNNGAYAAFPYDAGLLFGGALDAALVLATEGERDALHALAKTLQGFEGQPNPYVALMSADGDRMGVFVDRAQSPSQHAAISAAIAGFADRVPAIARQHRGHAIFNGGEDLMVAFPLDCVVAGARALSEAFNAAVSELVNELIDADTRQREGVPTLRAGVAICHVSEPMGYIRECAGEAEKFAKGQAGGPKQGNALGLHLHVRAGHEVALRLPFDNPSAFEDFNQWVHAYTEGALPGRVAYDIRAVGATTDRLLKGRPAAATVEHAVDITATELARVLDRARRSGGAEEISAPLRRRLEERSRSLPDGGLPAAEARMAAKACFRLGDELVLARWLSARSASELGERGGD